MRSTALTLACRRFGQWYGQGQAGEAGRCLEFKRMSAKRPVRVTEGPTCAILLRVVVQRAVLAFNGCVRYAGAVMLIATSDICPARAA